MGLSNVLILVLISAVWKSLDNSSHNPQVLRCCLIHNEHDVPYHDIALGASPFLTFLQLWEVLLGPSLPEQVGHVLD